ncbi:hypothetical protein [Ralstonia holmesii]|uniref:hypothetical protein n=1 Tax=Ralstonia holmesii TaxID=3058602 RepID=UPI0028F51582|nr:hypothetical protein [Ralstonia sp. LMG 32967]CAJ0705953.1 hypothetical protein R11007_04735 [Ralstonia sp. LMG 32967]
MDFSLTPEEYIQLARYCAVVVIVAMSCGWALASVGRPDVPEDDEDERAQKRRY